MAGAVSFRELTQLLERELHPPVAERVVGLIRSHLAGRRINVPVRQAAAVLRDQDIDAALKTCGHSVDRAAKRLGVAPAVLYRRLDARRQKRQQPGKVSRLVR